MKGSMVVLAALVATAAVAGRAQSTDHESLFPPVDRYATVSPVWFDHQYAPSLNSDNDGVVESAIAQSVVAKLALPEGKFEAIREKLGSLSVHGRTAAIKYKAYLAGLVLENPAMFRGADCSLFASTDQLFASLSARIQKQLLSVQGARYVRER